MNPEQLAKPGCNEHMEQAALFCWANRAMTHGFAIANGMENYAGGFDAGLAIKPVPELKWLHAIPNAGARGNKVAAGELKAEGVKAGVADIFLPVRRRGVVMLPGIYVELKRTGGKQSDISKEQQEFRAFVESQGYVWVVAFGWRMAAEYIQYYLEQPLS